MLKLCKRVACTNTHKSYKIVQNVLYNKKLPDDRKFVHLLDNILQVTADLVFCMYTCRLCISKYYCTDVCVNEQGSMLYGSPHPTPLHMVR